MWTLNPAAGCGSYDMVDVVVMVVSGVCTLFFAIFVVAMMCDQWEGLTTDTTGIEALKNWLEVDRSAYEGLQEVFGGPFSWQWLLTKTPPPQALFNPLWDLPDASPLHPRDPATLDHFLALVSAAKSIAALEDVDLEAELARKDRKGSKGSKGSSKSGGDIRSVTYQGRANDEASEERLVETLDVHGALIRRSRANPASVDAPEGWEHYMDLRILPWLTPERVQAWNELRFAEQQQARKQQQADYRRRLRATQEALARGEHVSDEALDELAYYEEARQSAAKTK
jgi:hypothetical protein